MEIPSHELRSFRVGLVLLHPAIARCDHPIYPLSPLLPATANLNIKMSNLDREIQLLREESSISLSDRDFALRLLQNPEFLQGFSSTETVHKVASALSSQNEEASDSLDARSSQQYVNSISVAFDHYLLIVILGTLLHASSYQSLDHETTGLLRLLHQSRIRRRLS